MTCMKVFVAGLLLSGTCFASAGVYDASLNTLPTAQGWTLGGLSSPAPTVSGGIFYGGPTDYSGSQYFINFSESFDFTSAQGLHAEMIAKMDTSTYYQAGLNYRTGFNFGFIDNNGYFFGFGLASSDVILTNLNVDGHVAVFNTTSAFHRYTLDVAGGVATLSIDGVSTLTDSLGLNTGSPNLHSGYWGDTTGLGDYTGEVKSARFGSSGLVPEPGSIGLLLLGIGALARKRKPKILNPSV